MSAPVHLNHRDLVPMRDHTQRIDFNGAGHFKVTCVIHKNCGATRPSLNSCRCARCQEISVVDMAMNPRFRLRQCQRECRQPKTERTSDTAPKMKKRGTNPPTHQSGEGKHSKRKGIETQTITPELGGPLRGWSLLTTPASKAGDVRPNVD